MFTTLVAVLVALALGHVAPAAAVALRRVGWYRRWLQWLNAHAAETAFWRGRHGWLVALVPFVLVLALLPEFENRGIGRQLLQDVVSLSRDAGHSRLFLACSADPRSRSHGFYRHLGWKATGEIDEAGDEILELA